MVKNYIKSYIYLFGFIIVLTAIFSLFNYFFIFSTKIIKILIPVISILISSIILGKNTKSKAYLEGIKFSSFYIGLSILMSLFFKNDFSFRLIIFYLLILLSGIIGSMIGINLNKK